ncbi:MAG: DUF1592 domain-containing protein [Myxococcota bacterium]
MGPTAEPEPVPVEPAPFQRLTAPQLRNTLVDLLGPVPYAELQPDDSPNLFRSIGAATTPYSELGVDRVEAAVAASTALVFFDPERRRALVGCEPVTPGDACVRAFLEDFGLRAYRRPLRATELELWTWVATDLAEGDPWTGVESAVTGLLQSPHALYRVEIGEPDAQDASRLRLTGFEVASRLSYLLWDTTPDSELLAAAARGDLNSAAGIEVQARRLLADERARRSTRAFFDQYLDLGRLGQVTRDPEAYPEFTASLPGAMRTEVHLVVDDLVHRRNADIRALYSGRRTFVNPELAAHYGLPVPKVSPITFVPVELPADGPRAGIQSQGAFLTMNAHPIDTSPTLRGKFVMERILCEFVPPPPGDVDLEIKGDDDGEPRTLRERLERHRSDPDCAYCHALTDPPGFLFEHFDAVGRWRELDNGLPIDASGALSGEPLDGARSLAVALAEDPRVPACMTLQLFRHAHGRVETRDDLVSIEQIEASFIASEYRFQELLIALVTHESFRAVAPVEGAP